MKEVGLEKFYSEWLSKMFDEIVFDVELVFCKVDVLFVNIFGEYLVFI